MVGNVQNVLNLILCEFPLCHESTSDFYATAKLIFVKTEIKHLFDMLDKMLHSSIQIKRDDALLTRINVADMVITYEQRLLGFW